MIKFISKILTVVTVLIFVTSCSNVKPYISRNDDAVRLNADSAKAKNYIREPNTQKERNGSALRGEVSYILKKVFKDTSSTDSNAKISNSWVVFKDSLAFGTTNAKEEYIPFSALDTIFYQSLVKRGFGENSFENYNNPLNNKAIREVSVVVKEETNIKNLPNPQKDLPPPPKDCGCQPFELNINGPNIDCPSRDFSDFMLEAKIGYAAFTDKLDQVGKMKGTDANFAELVLAYRFGEQKQWAFGMAYSSGVPLTNQFSGERITRPIIMLHGKKTFERFLCLFPFMYGQIGVALDKLTLDLGKISLSNDCTNKLKVLNPNVDLSIPISYGVGFGLDIPIVPFMDLSIDLGYRSYAFGESQIFAGFSNFPSQRRTNMFLLRFGVTF